MAQQEHRYNDVVASDIWSVPNDGFAYGDQKISPPWNRQRRWYIEVASEACPVHVANFRAAAAMRPPFLFLVAQALLPVPAYIDSGIVMLGVSVIAFFSWACVRRNTKQKNARALECQALILRAVGYLWHRQECLCYWNQ
jgi:hypothetical protein